ncbi:unnamed protein product [Didymodactylos carnosus]|uniref:Calponin-homology (CH) domain-containing protein n=1 Tax=Didymodactylos carnosus TaxID=1234261 RepID=A0A814V737_9BILA|nr:unnamed protein product [Didymodactylos carnosus]CAF3949330.1 unnamed protein product [Didymodactylos carnosus]
MAWEMELDENILEDLYVWIDSMPLSKSKKRIERDFSDGVLVAEVVRYYLPELIEMHNYTTANSIQQKRTNWGILNKKVLNSFGLDLPDTIITGLCNGKPGLVEVLLYNLRLKIDEELELQQKSQQHQQTTPRGSRMSFGISDSGGRSTKLTTTALNSVHMPKGSTTIKNGRAMRSTSVPRIEYEEAKQLNLKQQEELEVLHAKVRRLEHVLQLKDVRIQELLQATKEVKPTHVMKKKF